MSDSTELAEVRYDKVIDMTQERFQRNAPKHIRFENEKGYAIQLLQNNAYLMEVASKNPVSLQQAITNIAAIGLSLNPAKKQAYLITRTIRTPNGQFISKVFLEPSYVGLCDLATMSGAIEWVQASCVYAQDSFVDNGLGMRPTHTYDAFAKDRGELAGVYCTAKTTKGDYLTTVMRLDEINGIRDRSEAYKAFKERNKGNGGPWVTDFEEMAKKSVVRRAFKMWPKTAESERLENAVMISNENEGFEPILSSPPLGQYTGEQKTYFDQLITKADAVEMFLFTKSIDESIFTSLYHSFEKGQKGKYQRIIDDLCRNGQDRLHTIAAKVDEHAGNSDDAGILEELHGLSGAAIAWVSGMVSAETGEIIRLLQRGEEQANG